MFFTKFFKSYQKRSISINSKYCYIKINMLHFPIKVKIIDTFIANIKI